MYGYVIICLFYLTVVKVVKRYVRRFLNTVSSYILGEDVIENKWFKLFLNKEFAQIFSVLLPETSRFLILNSLSFPLQEDFF